MSKKNSKNNIDDEIIEKDDTEEIIEDDNFEDNIEFENGYDETEDIEENETLNSCILDKAIDDDVDDIPSEIEEINEEENLLKGDNRISANRLTKYEMVRILGERTKQLTMGAKPLIKNYEGLNYERISEEELKLNMIPYKIKRPLPNGKFEIWTLEELKKDHLLTLLE